MKTFYGAERYLGVVGCERLDAKSKQAFVNLWILAFGRERLEDHAVGFQLFAQLSQQGAAWNERFLAVEVADLDVNLQMSDAGKFGLAQIGHLFGELLFRAPVPEQRVRFGHELLPIANQARMLRGENDLLLYFV